MTDHTPDLAELIGARICHDLISPIGALTNGLELMELSGAASGPEMALVSDSAAAANARIRLFRLAFGRAGAAPPIDAAEVAAMLQAAHDTRRLSFDWQPEGALPRREAQALALAVLCVLQALPQGGCIGIERDAAGGWCLQARGPRLRADPALWACLTGAPSIDIGPAQVQFLLLPRVLEPLGRRCHAGLDPDRITLGF